MVHSFPTRRSSDLAARRTLLAGSREPSHVLKSPPRSEEHTSELQSHHPISYAVFCLKKKKELIRAVRRVFARRRSSRCRRAVEDLQVQLVELDLQFQFFF